MWVHAIRAIAILTSFVAAVPLLWAQSNVLTLDQILNHMQQTRAAEQERGTAYTVTREYQLSAGGQQPTSDVVAQVSFIPPTAKEYTIVKSEGNDRATGIVRKVLDHETVMATHAQLNEISQANYNFAMLGQEVLDGHDCYVLQLTPKREAPELVRGKVWVDAGNFEIRRIAGETAKTPTFWIKKLNITLNYGQVNGVWLQTSTQAVADVRVAGTHTLTSRELDVQPATVNARAQLPSPVHNRRSDAHRSEVDAATWVAR